MNKFLKMAAIASVAIALFASCSTDKKEPVDVHVNVMTICISRTELTRAFADPIPDGAVPQFDSVSVSVNKGIGALRFTLKDADLQRALTPAGYRVPVTDPVTEVTLDANNKRGSGTIMQFQGSTVPLTATATGTDIVATVNPKDSEKVTYSVNLSLKPIMARLEVFGKIEALNPAWDRFEIEEVYVNNYILSPRRPRNYTPGNGENNFAKSPAIKKGMYDKVPRDVASQTAFQNGTKVIAYHLYPLTEKERAAATPPRYFDHLILKIKAVPTDPSQTAREGFLTIRSFYENTKGDLKGFEAGKIYKFNLGTLSDMFNVANANDLPITSAPESGSPHSMSLRTKSITWTPNNATPSLNEYK